MRFDVLTLFPEMFASVLSTSILKRAADSLLASEKQAEKQAEKQSQQQALEQTKSDSQNKSHTDSIVPASPINSVDAPVSYHLTDIRDFTTNKHHKVDKSPYGGGPGMVMQCQPVWDAVMHAEAQDLRPATRILMTPQGVRLDQKLVEELAAMPRILLIAGHYEGIDERVIEKLEPIRQISIGDYVLSGGELPAMVLIDSIVRLIPGVLGHEESAHFESFSPGSDRLLDHPHYTRPPEWMGMKVPDVLLSGDHAKIDAWRKAQALKRTQERRPDLLKGQ